MQHLKGGIVLRRRAQVRLWADSNTLVLTMHVLLASFVAFHAYPATQDGPAHLYGAHIVAALRRHANSPYRDFFSLNLHPVANSLFTYLAIAVERYANINWAVRIALFAALVGMPLSTQAFARALRSQCRPDALYRLPVQPTTSLACLLAYNYFTYRGLFNYALSIPFVFGCLAAVLAVGAPRRSFGEQCLLALGAGVCALLAALAHPGALAFLLVAIAVLAVSASFEQRVVAATTATLLFFMGVESRIKGDISAPTRFMSPWSSLLSFVRALGITQSWFEVLPACALLAAAIYAASRALPRPARVRAEWTAVWPALLACAMTLGFFVMPFEYGGAAGLNERIPLLAVLLLLPYFELPTRLSRFWPAAFASFAVYTAAERVRLDRSAQGIRDSAAADVIPRGSVVYALSLRVKLGAVSADLGRHLLADVARRRELVAGTVFCSHPAHVLRCTSRTPPVGSEDAIQAFEHLSSVARGQALTNPRSPIRVSFEEVKPQAAKLRYWLVLDDSTLGPAFDRFVAAPLGARLLSNPADPIRVYENVGAPD
ncbi:MAG: hypothetical protein ABJB12_22820 [Pseudomonadota bacterium]